MKKVKDGSIKSDLDADKTAYSLAFLTTGFFHLLSETGKTYTQHFGLGMDKFVDHSMELLVSAIRPE